MDEKIAPLTNPRAATRRAFCRFLLVWLLGCLLVTAYAALVVALVGTPSWLEVIVFGGWVLVAGTWLLVLPSRRWSPWAGQVAWGAGVAALVIVLVFTALPWVITPTYLYESTGATPLGLLIPDALNRWMSEISTAYNNRDVPPGLMAISALSIVATGLALAGLALVWRLVYEGLKPYTRRFWPWLGRRWRQLEAVPFWVAVKRLVQGAVLLALLAVGMGLLLTGRPTRAVAVETAPTVGLEPGRPPAISSLAIGPDGDSLFAFTAGEVYRSTDWGESWRPTTPHPGFGVGSYQLAVQDSKAIFVRTDSALARWDETSETWQPAGEGLPYNLLWRTQALPNGEFFTHVANTVYRSQDGGQTWQPANEGLAPPEGIVGDLKLLASPNGQSILAYTSNNLHLFDTTQSRWHHLYSAPDGMLFGDVLGLPSSRRLVATTSIGVIYSDDEGQTWRAAAGLDGFDLSMSLDRGIGPDSLLAWGGTGLYGSDDGGRTWLAKGELDKVESLITLPASGTLIVAYSFLGWHRSTDGGDSWQPLGGLLSDADILTVVETPRGDKLFAATGDGVFRSADRGATWEPVNHGLGVPSITALAHGPGSQTLLAALGNSGMLRSTDGGLTWQRVGPELEGRFIPVLIVGPDGREFFAATFGGIFRSRDNGLTWSPIGPPLDAYSVTALSVGPDGRALFAGTFGPGVFRSVDGGDTWTPAYHGIEGDQITSLAVGPDGRSLFAATAPSGVFRSFDNGASWEPAGSGLGESTTVNVFRVNPSNGVFFAGTDNGLYAYDAQSGVWRLMGLPGLETSIYAMTVDPNMPGLLLGTSDGLYQIDSALEGNDLVNPLLWGLAVRALMLHPTDGILWVGSSKGLFRTQSSSGVSEEVDTGPELLVVNDLIAAVNENELFLATPMGVYRSTDGGATWQPANDGLNDINVTYLARNAYSSSILAYGDFGAPVYWEPSRQRWQVVEPSSSLLPTAEVRLEQRRGVYIARPTMRYALPWVNTLPYPYALALNEAQRSATVYSVDPLGKLTRQQIPLPVIWNWPATYVNLIGAAWAGVDWVWANLTPLMLVISLVALFVGTYVYAAIVRPNRLSPRLALWLLPKGRHLLAAAGYHGYRVRWDAQRPLERFLWLFARQSPPFTTAEAAPQLHAAGVACDEAEVELALSGLARQGALREEKGRWALVEPLLADVLARDLPADMSVRLAATIRNTNLLYLETQAFLQDASFDLTPQGDFGFRLSGDLPGWRDRLPCYVRVLLERALDLEVVREISHADVGHDPAAGERLALAAIDRAPQASDLHYIFATRAQTGLTIVPLPLSVMRQARIDRNTLDTLNEQINLYTGQQDMYNVTTAVSDVLSFFGRQGQLAELRRSLTTGRSVMVYGVRKIGKSSLLHRLREESGWPTAIIDAGGYATGLPFLMDESLRQWRAIVATEHRQLSLPDWDLGPITALGARKQAFRQAVWALLDQLATLPGRPGLLLFLDEMEYLYAKDPVTFSEVAGDLRTIATAPQARGRFALLVAGLLPDLNRVDHLVGARNPFFNFFEEKPVGPLELGDARTMVISLGGQMGVNYDDEALDLLAQTGGGHPLLTRQLCYVAIDRRAERPLTIDADAARRAIQNYLWQPDNYLANSLWPDSRGAEGGAPDPDEEAILLTLAGCAPRPEAELLPESLLPAERLLRLEALARLRNLSVIRQNGEGDWSITIPLYETWLRQTKLNLGDESDDAQSL